MTAEQLISKLRCLPPDARTADEFMQYLRLGLSHIEKHIFELRLADDQHLNDLSDFAQLLRELRDATLGPLPPELRLSRFAQDSEQDGGSDFCPRCGHIHVDPSECGFPQGGGRICRCERQVPA